VCLEEHVKQTLNRRFFHHNLEYPKLETILCSADSWDISFSIPFKIVSTSSVTTYWHGHLVYVQRDTCVLLLSLSVCFHIHSMLFLFKRLKEIVKQISHESDEHKIAFNLEYSKLW
jgi:hypothetical protein